MNNHHHHYLYCILEESKHVTQINTEGFTVFLVTTLYTTPVPFGQS